MVDLSTFREAFVSRDKTDVGWIRSTQDLSEAFTNNEKCSSLEDVLLVWKYVCRCYKVLRAFFTSAARRCGECLIATSQLKLYSGSMFPPRSSSGLTL